MVFKTDKNFVTKVAFRAFTAPQLLRQFCPSGRRVFAVQAIVRLMAHCATFGVKMNNEIFIKKCYELAIQAGKKGYDTFGAILVHDGKILEEAENTSDYKNKIFGHAEFNLVHKCANKFSDDVLENAIVYTSCAPCERCLAAIASLGVHQIVCGVSYKEFCKLLPFDYKVLDREGLLKQLGITMKLTESILEDEGMHVFEWWGGEYRPLKELIAEMDEVKKRK